MSWEKSYPEVNEKVREEIEEVDPCFNSRPHPLLKQFKAAESKA